jgi:hypothetical protein
MNTIISKAWAPFFFYLLLSSVVFANPHAKYKLSVYANPIQAKVEVDGRVICEGLKNDLSPCEIEVEAGKHHVKVLLDGFETKEQSFDIAEETSVNWSLKQLSFQLSVISYPIGTKIWVDGELMGESPILALQLKPNSKHFVRVEANCHQTKHEEVIGNIGESKTLQIKLDAGPCTNK